MPEFGKRQGITDVKCRSSANAPANDGRLSEARQASRQTTGDFPKLGKRPGKQRDKKQETIYNHFIKKKEFIMANESKVIQIGTIDLHGMTNDAHFMYMKDVENAMETD